MVWIVLEIWEMDEDDGAIDADAGAGEIRASRDENSRIRTNVGKEMGRSGLLQENGVGRLDPARTRTAPAEPQQEQ